MLATVANKSSKVSVEQIVGRVLRQPYVSRASARSLNIAYVLTASADFNETVQQVVRGLNGVGFSQEDVVDGGGPVPDQDELPIEPERPDEPQDGDDIGDLDLHFLKLDTQAGDDLSSDQVDTSVDDIIGTSVGIEEKFDDDAEKEVVDFPLGGLGADVNTYKMRIGVRSEAADLLLPQFHIKVDGGLFTYDETWKLLDRDDLLQDFKLSKYGIDGVKIDVNAFGDARSIDLADDSDEYKVRWVEEDIKKNMRTLFSQMSDDGRRVNLEGYLYDTLSAQFKNTFGEYQIKDFIHRVIADMDQMTVDGCFDSISSVSSAIKKSVQQIADDFCEKRFNILLDAGTIELRNSYRFPDSIYIAHPTTSYDRTLYEAESDDMNDGIEKPMAELLANSPSIVWWHRVTESKETEFRINSFINHYPDFLALRRDGTIMAIETKVPSSSVKTRGQN